MNLLILFALIISVIVNSAVLLGLADRWLSLRRRRTELETYLRAERLTAINGRTGLHTTVHLITKLGLTEAEILHASARSRHIFRMSPMNSEPNRVSDVLFGYQE